MDIRSNELINKRLVITNRCFHTEELMQSMCEYACVTK